MHDLFSGMTTATGPLWAAIAALVALAALTALMLTMLRGERSRGETAAQVGRLADIAERLTASQAELAGRLQQTQTSLDQRLDGLARGLGDGLLQQTERTGETLRVLHERLALIDSAQQTIAELSSQVVGLHNILDNKQARGAWGEVQLEALVRSMLPPNAFQFQATLSNNCRVDCLLRLPDRRVRWRSTPSFRSRVFRPFAMPATSRLGFGHRAPSHRMCYSTFATSRPSTSCPARRAIPR